MQHLGCALHPLLCAAHTPQSAKTSTSSNNCRLFAEWCHLSTMILPYLRTNLFSFMICFPMGHDSGTKKVTKAANQCNRTSMEPLDEVDPFELVQFHLATVQALVPHKDIDFSRSRVSNFGSYQKINGLASYLFLECATNHWLFESATAKANMKALNLSGVPSSKFQLQQPSAILERRWGPTYSRKGVITAIQKDKLSWIHLTTNVSLRLWVIN